MTRSTTIGTGAPDFVRVPSVSEVDAEGSPFGPEGLKADCRALDEDQNQKP
jgi:hypothetical protein